MEATKEKPAVDTASCSKDFEEIAPTSSLLRLLEKFQDWEERFGVEGRGIERVSPNDRIEPSNEALFQILFSWISINTVGNNMVVGMMGPYVYGLSFKDTAWLIVIANMLGALGPFYVAGLGPVSGNRTLVILRFVFGWWPSKICSILQLVGNLGYGIINTIIIGQILSAVSPNGSLSVVVGVIIGNIIIFFVCVFGMRIFHLYERYAMLPQLVIFFIMVGCAGMNFDTTTPTVGTPEVIRGNRISFFFIIFCTTFLWSMCCADYFVYYPEKTSRLITGALSHVGITLSLVFVELMGAGLASGAPNIPEWASALEIGTGNLMVEAFAPLGTFGHFCAVVLALGTISNTIPGIYSSAMAWQTLGHGWSRIPRSIWTMFGVVICAVCAAAGRNSLFDIFLNFLAFMGYWVSMWLTIQLLDEFLFRKLLGMPHHGYRWEEWNSQEKLPLGLAALVSFLIGFVGAVLCMYQAWFIGPLAKGAYGDIGLPVGVAWAGLLYVPLRWLELQYFKR